MFKVPFDTQDIGGQLRRGTEAKGQRSIRIDLNMQDPYQALYRESRMFPRVRNLHGSLIRFPPLLEVRPMLSELALVKRGHCDFHG